MRQKSAKLTDTDWVLLNTLWDAQPQTMGQIVQAVRASNGQIHWSYKTYYTYLNNLCAKNFAAFEIRNAKADRLYYPLITREDALALESESVLTRVKHLSMLMATMAKSDQLSPDEQNELRLLADKLHRKETSDG